MRGVRFSLFTRIIIWFFLNLLLLGAILFVFFGYNFRFRPNSGFSGAFSSSNIEVVTRQIISETDQKSRAERDAVLKNYSEKYRGVEFFLFDNRGSQIGGRRIDLPPEVFKEITRPEMPPPGAPAQQTEQMQPPPPPPMNPPLPPGPPPSIYLRTENPTRYWFGARVGLFNRDEPRMVRARLLAVSDSFYGYGLFFNPLPWLVLTAIIVIVSILFWFPLVRSMTGAVGQITRATEQIAEENFDVRVSEKRTDELGRLGKAINHLAERLSGFVGGQKRFLGDISHELNSPLARMAVSLSILEEQADQRSLAYIRDVQEEVEIMSQLVKELLAYSKAGIRSPGVELEEIPLEPLVRSAAERENGDHQAAEINIRFDPDLRVLARPELLSRAFGNVIRNAVSYAGGELDISGQRSGNGLIEVTVADRGPGVPDEALGKIFDPLYRLDTHRSRETGGSGLGLAIVKTCIEACGGKVQAENRPDGGLAVKIFLKTKG